MKYLGVDIGSTTVKATVIDGGEIKYGSYIRHGALVKETVLSELNRIIEALGDGEYCVAFTGSAGMGFARRSAVSFVQEVQAAYIALKKHFPTADVMVELGGEDAKIIYVTGGAEQRMNGSCAGGTGAFIDQMATLLGVSNEQLDELALSAQRVYPIASRCGVFAKSDIQPLINQGAAKSDIAASIFQAVVDQTVSGLAQGRKIGGNVVFLGGPLYFFKGLQKAFKESLRLSDEQAIFPKEAPRFMSIGAALYAEGIKPETLSAVIERIKNSGTGDGIVKGKPLFASQAEYEEFLARHESALVQKEDPSTYKGDCYIGIDSGSTTTKMAVITPDHKLLWSCYLRNDDPLKIVLNKLGEFYSEAKGATVKGCAVTGYGEELIQNAIKADFGLVETIAHYKAAMHFNKDVDFIIDIGGQDIKCFKIKNGAIDSIMLNEACSSGCGSFIQTFASSLGMDVAEFSRLGLFAPSPVELGSRCTVFMNSSVKQAQKEGASVADISAGLSASIVKNAIYKVIRTSPDKLGDHIVAQGGTFLNDAVLRSFELELNKEVIRPQIAGLMGAFGAALYAMEKSTGSSTTLTLDELNELTYTTKAAVCRGCTSNCNINIVNFSGGRSFILGNKCEKGAGKKPSSNELDIYAYKQERLFKCIKGVKGGIKVGLPVQLGMMEQLPLWAGFFERLGLEVVVSERSSRKLYFDGQHTIASDTVCYPAKLMHGHVESLLNKADFIFLPCESYNLDEGRSTNHYNCPVVAYYPELLKANNPGLTGKFVMPYIDLNRRESAAKTLTDALAGFISGLTVRKVRAALNEGFKRAREYHSDVVKKADEIIKKANDEGKQIIVLCGRPYHLDGEINHGINKLLTSYGVAVLSEDSIFERSGGVKVNVLNQWTYHSRLYRAADYASRFKNMNIVQLVSFGCGLDAITSDELRSILEKNGRLYTQIKIDEINNLGVVKIRLRSLLSAIEEKK